MKNKINFHLGSNISTLISILIWSLFFGLHVGCGPKKTRRGGTPNTQQIQGSGSSTQTSAEADTGEGGDDTSGDDTSGDDTSGDDTSGDDSEVGTSTEMEDAVTVDTLPPVSTTQGTTLDLGPVPRSMGCGRYGKVKSSDGLSCEYSTRYCSNFKMSFDAASKMCQETEESCKRTYRTLKDGKCETTPEYCEKVKFSEFDSISKECYIDINKGDKTFCDLAKRVNGGVDCLVDKQWCIANNFGVFLDSSGSSTEQGSWTANDPKYPYGRCTFQSPAKFGNDLKTYALTVHNKLHCYQDELGLEVCKNELTPEESWVCIYNGYAYNPWAKECADFLSSDISNNFLCKGFEKAHPGSLYTYGTVYKNLSPVSCSSSNNSPVRRPQSYNQNPVSQNLKMCQPLDGTYCRNSTCKMLDLADRKCVDKTMINTLVLELTQVGFDFNNMASCDDDSKKDTNGKGTLNPYIKEIKVHVHSLGDDGIWAEDPTVLPGGRALHADPESMGTGGGSRRSLKQGATHLLKLNKKIKIPLTFTKITDHYKIIITPEIYEAGEGEASDAESAGRWASQAVSDTAGVAVDGVSDFFGLLTAITSEFNNQAIMWEKSVDIQFIVYSADDFSQPTQQCETRHFSNAVNADCDHNPATSDTIKSVNLDIIGGRGDYSSQLGKNVAHHASTGTCKTHLYMKASWEEAGTDTTATTSTTTTTTTGS